MKIVNRYLVRLEINPYMKGDKKIFEVVELVNGSFYRLNFDSGNHQIQHVDKEEMYEAIAESNL